MTEQLQPQKVFEAIRSKHPGAMMQRMRRCFMTGKQCIFCTESSLRAELMPTQERDSVFVIMPFRPNLDTFFDWSLRRYLASFEIPHEKIRRADFFSDIGYVMCEKICRRIQDAGLVVVDLSLENPNVYYELGIAVGLGKPLFLLCDKNLKKPENGYEQKKKRWLAIGVPDPDLTVIGYPNVGLLGTKDNHVADKSVLIKLGARKPEMQIKPLLIVDDTSPIGFPTVGQRDIQVGFPDAVSAAVGVAIDDIVTKADSMPNQTNAADRCGTAVDSELRTAVDALRVTPSGPDQAPINGGNQRGTWKSADQLDRLRNCQPHVLEHRRKDSVEFADFQTTLKQVDTAFLCIVDLAGENVLSYFWLGYCHARNINVIPVHRKSPPAAQSSATGMTSNKPEAGNPDDRVTRRRSSNSRRLARRGRSDKEHILAFDIRALWNVRYNEENPRELASTLQAAIEELLVRDVMTQERRAFWERLTRSGQVHIFNGAIHHPNLNREMVGDWDLRTVSELVQYLSSTEESVVPVLERPVYAPETIREKLQKPDLPKSAWTLDDHSAYVELIKDELRKKRNCLIVASADVNPITEVALAYAYTKVDQMPGPCFQEPGPEAEEKNVVIALKQRGKDDPTRRFSRTTVPKSSHIVEANERGFYARGQALSVAYKSQDEAKGEFHVLAHLLIMRNPFTDQGAPDRGTVVILNGVSGPGTYALAQMLTGSGTGRWAKDSERLLREINRWWDDKVEQSKELRGVEAILDVTISPPETDEHHGAPAGSQGMLRDGDPADETDGDSGRQEQRPLTVAEIKRRVEDKFYDRRVVEKWDYVKVQEGGKLKSWIKTFPVED